MQLPEPALLETTLAEIEAHVGAAGWDLPPTLFALVWTGRFVADEPDTARRLGLDHADPLSLTPVEQQLDGAQPLAELLAGIQWPEAVSGCALAQEIVFLPPSAEAELGEDDGTLAERAARHPARREARLVAGALRSGAVAAVLRLRAEAADGTDGELLVGPDLAPNLVAALRATFEP